MRCVHAKVCFINNNIKFLKRILLYSFCLLSVSFNSHNCDENARRVSEDKEYILTWLGKTDPRLCSFNFTGGSTDESHSVYKVCYQSVDIELPPFDMFLVVSNDSKKWVSMNSNTLIRSSIYLWTLSISLIYECDIYETKYKLSWDESAHKNIRNFNFLMEQWWSWLYGSLIYNYLCNLCLLSPLKLWVRTPFMPQTWGQFRGRLWASKNFEQLAPSKFHWPEKYRSRKWTDIKGFASPPPSQETGN